MNNKYINLHQLRTNINSPKIEEKYIRYICGLNNDTEYHQLEIKGICKLIELAKFSEIQSSNFLYGYCVPQMSKEFDLIKVSKEKSVNIELKSKEIALDRIKKQLLHNKHYLNIISPNVFLFTYVCSNNTIYELVDDKLIEIGVERLRTILDEFDGEQLDLDLIFTPSNILVSPLNSPQKFIDGKYLLTDQQEQIKRQLLDYVDNNYGERFFGLTGSAGTGKTLLIYDVAKELSLSKKILIVHSGLMCAGHMFISNHFSNIRIIEAKELRLREIKDVDIVIIDEAHRLYGSIFDKAVRWTKRVKSICVFSFDPDQKMSFVENRRNTDLCIKEVCGKNIAELKGKIRTNKNVATFIKCLFDLSKCRGDICFEGIRIIYEKNERKAVSLALELENSGYKYISYTPSSYDSSLDYQSRGTNTHKVIGQEYDNVVMILNNYFEYDGDILSSKPHPNPDYMFPKLLFQGLTRARSKICLVITKEELLSRVLSLFKE